MSDHTATWISAVSAGISAIAAIASAVFAYRSNEASKANEGLQQDLVETQKWRAEMDSHFLELDAARLSLEQETRKFQERLLELESSRDESSSRSLKKAAIRVNVDRRLRFRSGVDILVFKNEGPGEARSIQVQLHGEPIQDHPALKSAPKPIGIIGSGTEFSFQLRQGSGCPHPYNIEITWEDDSLEPGHFRTTLD